MDRFERSVVYLKWFRHRFVCIKSCGCLRMNSGPHADSESWHCTDFGVEEGTLREKASPCVWLIHRVLHQLGTTRLCKNSGVAQYRRDQFSFVQQQYFFACGHQMFSNSSIKTDFVGDGGGIENCSNCFYTRLGFNSSLVGSYSGCKAAFPQTIIFISGEAPIRENQPTRQTTCNSKAGLLVSALFWTHAASGGLIG